MSEVVGVKRPREKELEGQSDEKKIKVESIEYFKICFRNPENSDVLLLPVYLKPKLPKINQEELDSFEIWIYVSSNYVAKNMKELLDIVKFDNICWEGFGDGGILNYIGKKSYEKEEKLFQKYKELNCDNAQNFWDELIKIGSAKEEEEESDLDEKEAE